MTATIWHHARCSTSRRVLQMLRDAGLDPEVVNYAKKGWTADELRDLFAAAGVTAQEALRRRDPLVKELGLDAPGISDDAIIAAMVAHPLLVQRPFVRTAKGTRLCRPADRVQDLI